MPRFNSKTDGSRTVTPGGYDIYSIHATLLNGNVADIKGLVNTIEIIESIQTASIQVIMRLYDGMNFLENSHLIGGEKINLKIRRTSNTDKTFKESRDKFDIEVFVAAISGHTNPKPGLQAYTLECVSEHAMVSNTKKLNRSFNGVIGQLVTNIFTNDLGLENNVDFQTENISDSTDQIKGIYPNLSPLNALTWLTRNASNDGTPYFLYETIQDGLQFKSYNDMLEEGLYRVYNDASFNQSTPNTPENYQELEKKILRLNSDLNRSIYDSISDGSYSAKLHTIDISTKKYKQTQFVYDNEYKVDANIPFSEQLEIDNKKINEYTSNKEYYVSLNSKSFGKDMNYHKPATGSLLNKQSYFNNLGFIGLDMDIYGDFNLSVGRKVGIIIPKPDNNASISKGKRNFTDKYIGGSYIVSSISHYFSPEDYRCNIGLQKDSLGFNLDDEIVIGKSTKNTFKSNKKSKPVKTGRNRRMVAGRRIR